MQMNLSMSVATGMLLFLLGSTQGNPFDVQEDELRVAGIASLISKERRLKGHEDKKSAQFCNKDGSVDFTNEDSFNGQAFQSKFSPICRCVDQENTKKDMDLQDQWVGSGASISTLSDRAGDVISTISGEKSYECINDCEFCFASSEDTVAKKCGIYESTYKYTYETIAGSNTVDVAKKASTFGGGMDGKEKYIHSSFFYDFCFRHTVGAEGRVCFGTSPRGMAETKEALDECFVSHNSKLCSSCSRGGPNSTDATCFQANCTNVEGGGMIDSCNAETATGPFEIFGLYHQRTTHLTRGFCGDVEKIANHPTAAPKESTGGVGYTDSLVRVERVASNAVCGLLCSGTFWAATVISTIWLAWFI